MLQLFWDFHQQRRIWDLGDQAQRVRRSQDRQESRTERLEDRVAELERRLDKQTLVTMALFELLKQETSLDDEKLLAEVERIDLLDGRLDGRYAPDREESSFQCGKCGRAVSRTHKRCFYCGAQELYEGKTDVKDVL